MEVLTRHSNLELQMFFLLIRFTVCTVRSTYTSDKAWKTTDSSPGPAVLATTYYPIDQPAELLV